MRGKSFQVSKDSKHLTKVILVDNQSNHGIEEETARHRKKARGRKPFVIESRLVAPPGGWPEHAIWRQRYFRKFSEWHVHGRYRTESARDSAIAALVKQEESRKHFPYYDRMGRHEYRKADL